MEAEKELIRNYIINLISHIQLNRDLIEDDKILDKSCDIVDQLNNINYDLDVNSLAVQVKKLYNQWDKIYVKL